MSFGERLTQLRIEKGYSTRKSFAEKLGIPETTLRNYETDAREPGHTFLKQISDFFNVSCDYLLCLTDEREKMNSHNLKSFEYSMVKKYRFISTHSPDGAKVVDTVLDREYSIAEKMKDHAEKLKEPIHQNNLHTTEVRIINYYYRLASAGTGQIIFDMPPTKRIEIPNIPEYRKADYAIGVNGNSMEPAFHDGDTLLVEMAEEIELGEIGIFMVDSESYVKKLGKGELISLNPQSENVPLTENSRCMGRVIGKL